MVRADTGSVLQLETSGSYKSVWFQHYHLCWKIKNFENNLNKMPSQFCFFLYILCLRRAKNSIYNSSKAI